MARGTTCDDNLLELEAAVTTDTTPAGGKAGDGQQPNPPWGAEAEVANFGHAGTHSSTTTHVLDVDDNESERDEALLEMAEKALADRQPLDSSEAFAVLFALRSLQARPISGSEVEDGKGAPRAIAELPTRQSASPIIFEPGGTAFCVAPRNNGLRTRVRGECKLPENSSQVAFQSFSNAEIFWSTKRDQRGRRFGVAARSMSRRNKSTMEVHGFAGRWLCLICEMEASSGTFVPLVGELPSFVQVWIASLPAPFSGTRVRVRARCNHDRDREHALTHKQHIPQPPAQYYDDRPKAPSSRVPSEPSPPPPPVYVPGQLDIHQTLQVGDDSLVHGSIQVGGDVSIGGRFGCRGADFAEWFAWATDDSRSPGDDSRTPGTPVLTAALQSRAGSVVQLQTTTQRLSLNTDGAGPAVIISSAPSLVGNMPHDRARAAVAGGLVVLIGQAPVRCRGAVAVGDTLVPSGHNDGCAVSAGGAEASAADELAAACAGSPGHMLPRIGVALESSRGDHDEGDEGGGEHLVNCLVRWDDVAERMTAAALAATLRAEHMSLTAAHPERARAVDAAAGAAGAAAADRSALSSKGPSSVALCACCSKRAWQLGLFGVFCPCVLFARTHSTAARFEPARDEADDDIERGCCDGGGGDDHCCAGGDDGCCLDRPDRDADREKRASRRYVETLITFSGLSFLAVVFVLGSQPSLQKLARVLQFNRGIFFILTALLVEVVQVTTTLDVCVTLCDDYLATAGICRSFQTAVVVLTQAAFLAYAVGCRRTLRKRLGLLSGGIATVGLDCGAWACCAVCALVQEARQVELRAHYTAVLLEDTNGKEGTSKESDHRDAGSPPTTKTQPA